MRVGEWERRRVGEKEGGRGGEWERRRLGEEEAGRGGEWKRMSMFAMCDWNT